MRWGHGQGTPAMIVKETTVNVMHQCMYELLVLFTLPDDEVGGGRVGSVVGGEGSGGNPAGNPSSVALK